MATGLWNIWGDSQGFGDASSAFLPGPMAPTSPAAADSQLSHHASPRMPNPQQVMQWDHGRHPRYSPHWQQQQGAPPPAAAAGLHNSPAPIDLGGFRSRSSGALYKSTDGISPASSSSSGTPLSLGGAGGGPAQHQRYHSMPVSPATKAGLAFSSAPSSPEKQKNPSDLSRLGSWMESPPKHHGLKMGRSLSYVDLDHGSASFNANSMSQQDKVPQQQFQHEDPGLSDRLSPQPQDIAAPPPERMSRSSAGRGGRGGRGGRDGPRGGRGRGGAGRGRGEEALPDGSPHSHRNSSVDSSPQYDSSPSSYGGGRGGRGRGGGGGGGRRGGRAGSSSRGGSSVYTAAAGGRGAHGVRPVPAEASPKAGGPGRGGGRAPRGGGAGRNGKELRNLWQQVCQVSKGQKLDAADGAQRPEATVEGMLRMVCELSPGKSAVEAMAPTFGALDSRAAAALLKEIAKAGYPGRAVELFDWLRSQKEGSPHSNLCDVFTYTTMISLCTNRQHLRRAMELVAEMHSRGVACNVHTYSALMNVCIKCNELDVALDVYQEMQDAGCEPSLVTYNILIDMYGKAGRYEDALKVLDTMEHSGIDPEVRTYNSIISACSAAGQPAASLEVYERLVAAGKSPTATTFTALISAYGKAGQIDRAMEMFQEMVVHGCQRNVITFSSLISACEKAGCWELALEMLSDMHKEGCAPNVVTYNSLITACAQGCQWEKASELFERMQAEGCQPDSVTHSALISAYEKGGQWRRALEVYEQLQTENKLGVASERSGGRPGGRPTHNTAVHNTIVDVLWQTGVLCAQAKALQLYRKAFRSGHFRLSKQMQGDIEVHEVSVPPFTVGAAAISVHRWLLEMSAQLASGAGFQKPKVGFTVWRGKHGREVRHSMVKGAVLAILAGVQPPPPPERCAPGSPHSSSCSSPDVSPSVREPKTVPSTPPALCVVAQTPFVIVQDTAQCLKLEAKSVDLAKWLQSEAFSLRCSAFVTDSVSGLAGSAAAFGSLRRASGGLSSPDSAGLGLPGAADDGIPPSAFEYEMDVEIRCEKAFQAIRQCESCLILPSPESPWSMFRAEALVLIRGLVDDLCFEEESLHDSVLVADRAAAAGMVVPSTQGALVLLGASLQLVATQAGLAAAPPNMMYPPLSPAMAAAAALVSRIELGGGLAPGSCAETGLRLATVLGGDLRAISSLRCLKLFLERLGYEGPSANIVGHRAMAFLRSSLGAPQLLPVVPSQAAAAALYWDRTCSGSVPVWPTALANLTGYRDPNEPSFASATSAIAAVASAHHDSQQGSDSPVSPLQLIL